jgi:hypothetical protein
MSGDDSDGWEDEEDRMEAFFANANAEEVLLANSTEASNLPVVNEWELEADELIETPADPEDVTPEMEEVTVIFKTHCKLWPKQRMLELFQELGIQVRLFKNVNKRTIFDAIRDSDKVTKVSADDSFKFTRVVVPLHMQKGPKWILLQGVDVDLPEGFHPSGAEEGFFAPTNKDNVVGAPKKKYLTEAPIARPNFSKKPTKPKDGDAPRPVGRPPTSTSPKEQDHPSKYAMDKLLPIDFARRRPKDYFNLFMTDKFVTENIVKPTMLERAQKEPVVSPTKTSLALISRRSTSFLDCILPTLFRRNPKLSIGSCRLKNPRSLAMMPSPSSSTRRTSKPARSSLANVDGITFGASLCAMTLDRIHASLRRKTLSGR